MTELFISSLRSRPVFARSTVKVLTFRWSEVTPEQAANILKLCHGIRGLTLHIIANLPDHQNSLCAPLDNLKLTTLSLDLALVFYGPIICLSDLPLLCRIEHLHLTNCWVARRGLYIGLHELRNLTHISFPVQFSGQHNIHTEILSYILRSAPFPRLRVVILWRMSYEESRVIYRALEQRELVDHRIIVFNAARLAACAERDELEGFWTLAEIVVQWRRERD